MVAKIVYNIVPLEKILVDELLIPSSVIYSVAFFTYLFELVISEIFNQGIVPFCQYLGVDPSGVPPADISDILNSLIHSQESGISNGRSSVISTGSFLPIFS